MSTALGSGHIKWFLHDTFRCKPWMSGTIVRVGSGSEERSLRARDKRWRNQMERMKTAPWHWAEPVQRVDPKRGALLDDAEC